MINIDTEAFRQLAGAWRRAEESCNMAKASCAWRELVAHIEAWGKARRDQALADQMAHFRKCCETDQAEFNRKWTEQKERAEKAEADLAKLTSGISDALLKAKIWNGEVPLNGPQVLMLLNDLAEQAAPDALAQRAAGAPTAVVYPEDGTVSPFTVINLGRGEVKIGDCIHDGRLPALWFGKDGAGMGDEEVMNRAAKEGETLAVVTFSNVEGLDVLAEVVSRIRREKFPSARTVGGVDVSGLICYVHDANGDLCQAVEKSGGITDPGNAFVRLSAVRALLAAAPAAHTTAAAPVVSAQAPVVAAPVGDGDERVLMDWLESQEHVHALKWRCGENVKTALHDRDRKIIGEGPTFREAVRAALTQQKG